MKLYMVKASEHDIGDFQEAVVYAESPGDAIALVQDEIEKDWPDQAAGNWDYVDKAATLAATEVRFERGAILGHSHPC